MHRKLKLEDTYRYQLLENAVREHEIRTVFSSLRAVHIEPILLKGWSVGRLYPDPEVRRLGDIDLLVRDKEFPNAEKELSKQSRLNIDWHKLSLLGVEFAQPEDVVRRSQLVPLLDTEVRVLCAEDSLHFVAIHMLRHGGWSTVWVRDVAVLLESRQANFDWDICLGSEPTRAGWVLSALALTHKLIGADISGTPAQDHHIPAWLERTVRQAQGTPDLEDHQPPESIWVSLAHPWRLPYGIRKRWPNPVTAAIRTGVPFDRRSPFTHQLRYCADLTGNFFGRAVRCHMAEV